MLQDSIPKKIDTKKYILLEEYLFMETSFHFSVLLLLILFIFYYKLQKPQ